ncbi:hypothetical protein AC578_993 [Pseudocercospora eumusae]|uniref:CWH43-like N-terminal domain-containing protein n=1 Tax=Pseudocercospora eumusae TaxID=321146 RepID=A0A139GU68_9PEZI|nr:hypothetical protein AC578_993 [Pseudocercospora eumusae]
MLVVWVAQGSPILPRLSPDQRLAYISDIASTTWGKPLFIANSAITVSIFGLAFAAERWLRHRGLLLHVSSRRSTILSWCATVSTIIGAVGVIMLTVFDKKDHEMIHLCMVGVFINGYVFAAIFMALEKRRLSKKYPFNRYISWSWKIKAFFAALESVLTCFFVILAWCGYPNESVITEWCIAPLFCIYMCSFAMDFLPTPEMQVMDVSRLVLGAAGMGRDDDVSTIRNDSVASEEEKGIELGSRNNSC